ncbi:hypothetical protein EDC96DRAFT_562794 [Choanephora cucurbitarum]|nr:hypothetical protein EDC96DRAFT_562794 [Choanephora cucurbitarum]
MHNTFNRLTEVQRAIINNIMNAINVPDQVNLGRQAIENRLNELRRNNLSEAELLLQSQLLAQTRVFVTNKQQHSQTLQANQLANQNTINAIPAMREYLQLNQLKRRLQEVLSSNGNLFQQAEIICQQIALISSNPQGHTLFPKITHSTFWFAHTPKSCNQPSASEQSNMLQKTRKNINNWIKGLYPLYKSPFGITENDRVVGIDSGVRDIVCGVDCDAQLLTNKQTTKQHSFNVSNASYKLRSGMFWVQQKELKSRAQSGIQASYDRLQSRKVCTNEGAMQFLNSFASERTSKKNDRIHDFMRTYCHRENKGYTYSGRKMAQDYVARVILGRTKVSNDFKLAHSSSKSSRKRRRRYRVHLQDQLRPADDVRRTIVAYGDASICGTYRGNTPIPVKQIQRAIAEKAIVIPVDEFRTSVTCCHCHQRLDLVRAPMYVCNHRKKKHRSGGFDGNMFESRLTVKCYDEENHILHRANNRAIYPLKLCPQCPANNNAGLFRNRDVNAATNIRSILVEYIRSNYVLESRPAALTRG